MITEAATDRCPRCDVPYPEDPWDHQCQMADVDAYEARRVNEQINAARAAEPESMPDDSEPAPDETPEPEPRRSRKSKQTALLPLEPPRSTFAMVRLNQLPPSDDPVFSGRHADEPFVDSIATFGVQQPVVLVAHFGSGEDHAYTVEAGRKRILAARIVGLDEIPAMVIQDDGGIAPGAITLVENMHRSDNIYGQLVAVERLLAAGHSLDEIGSKLRLKKQRLVYLLKFQALIPELRQRLADHQLAIGVAEAAAALPASRQKKLAKLEKITLADVRHARESQRSVALDELDLDTEIEYEPEPSSERPGTGLDIIRSTRAHLTGVYDNLSNSGIVAGSDWSEADYLADQILSALTLLSGQISALPPHAQPMFLDALGRSRGYWEEVEGKRKGPAWGRALPVMLAFALAACAVAEGV